MSLYNMMMGRNPISPTLLGILGITDETADKWPLGRMRDVYVTPNGRRIFLFTRNGPSAMGLTPEQREDIEKNFRENHPQYVGFVIDDFDETYLTYEFRTPKHFIPAVQKIAEFTDTTPPMVRFRKVIKDMEDGVDNEGTKNAFEAGKKMMGPLMEVLDGKKPAATATHGDGGVDIINVPLEKKYE